MIFNESRSWAVVLICMMMVVGTLSVTPFASSGIENNNEVSKAAEPDIWVSPTSFNFTVPVNGTDSDTLMIGNNGTANLIYNISCSGQVNVSIDPVAHWALDETSGNTAYDSVGSLNGNIIGATINQPGEVGTSYWFDGFSDYVEIGHADTIDFSPGEDFSAYAWINTTSSNYGRIIEKREFPGDTAGYMMGIWDDGTLVTYLDFGSWGASVRGVVDIADGTWHHVGMTKYGNTLEAFVDGVSIGTNTSASGDFSNTDFLYIGTDCAVFWDFAGYIDDVRIYNQSVTPDEVYNGSNGVDWLNVFPETGSLNPFQEANHAVTVNTTGLDPGFYQANITIESNDPDENPVIIPVSLTIYDISQPDIWVTPTSFDFQVAQGGSDSDIMTVGNNGTTDLNYIITWTEPSSAMFLDDFDNETEGTSPPANWAEDATYTCQNLEIDDVHASSTPHSMWIKALPGASGIAHTDAALFTVNDSTPMYAKLYIADDSGYYMLWTQSVDGDLVSTEAVVQLVFDNNAGWLTGTARGIGYYNGAVYVNTGYTWTKDTWFTIKIVHNFGTDTFDAWYDSTQIVIGGGFINSESEVKSYHVLAQAGSHEMWIDDIQIGDVVHNPVNWLNVMPENGTLPSSSVTNHSVSVNTTGLDPGFYQANITVESNDPDEGTIIVPVNLTIYDISQPDIWVTPTSFDFQVAQGGSDSDIMTVGNNGTTDLNYIITWTEPSSAMFLDDFDNETEGTSPPANWAEDATYTCQNLEIDDAHASSTPHSMWIKALPGASGVAHTDSSLFTVNDSTPMYAKLYIADDSGYYMLMTQSVDGDYIDAEVPVLLVFDNSAGWLTGTTRGIGYSNGAVVVNTGYTWTKDTWFTIKIVHNFGSDTFDAWYDSTQIVTSGDVKNSKSEVKSYQVLAQAGSHEMWMDDIQIGDVVHNPVNWLNVMPENGTLPSSSVTNHSVSVNTAGLDPGFYQANITVESNDPDEGTIIVPVNLTVVSVVGQPLMNITKWAPATASPGDTITYWINYTNTGTSVAYNVVVFESYPAEVSFISAIPPPDIGDNVWIIGDLVPGFSDSIMVTVQVNVSASGSIVNYVDLTYDNSTGNPQTPVNDTAVTILGGGPQMAIRKTAPATANPGEIITYTIYFNNTGTGTADHVWINDTLPIDVIYISDTAAVLPYFMSSNIVGQTLYYEFANVPPGSYSFDITVYINPSVADGTILTNYVTCDYAPSGNQTEDWANTTVIRPVITVEKTVDMTIASPGDFLTYYIWFNNTGSAMADFVWINDTLPGGVVYVSDTSTTSPTAAPFFVSRGISGQKIWFNFTNVPPGVHSFEITVQIDSGVANGTVLINWVSCNYTAPNGQSLEETSDFATTLVGAGDSTPPSHSNEIPAINGRTNDPTPVISVHVTDPSGVDSSTIRLYIDGFMIFYDLMGVPDGYNVSYWHSMGFADGQVVVCRIVADDTLGNHLDFTWTFTVDLTAPWVVDTDPQDGEVDVPIDDYISVFFSEPMDLYWTELAFKIFPPVNGTIMWLNGSDGFIFDPTGPLQYNTTYLGVINILARDLAGNNMLANYTWSFTTQDTEHDPPDHSNESPEINGYTTVLDPTISVHVTDLSGVNASTIKFYIQGFRIFHELTPVQDGYNVSYWHDMGFTPGDVISCRIMAEDMLGNLLDFTWQFTVLSSFSVELHDGWNLVSFPLIPMNTSIEQVLSSISGQWDMVEYYNASDTNDHWKTYATFKPASLNDLWNLDNTMGFWLHMTNAATLVISGTEPTTTDISLYAGWNMVGYPTQNNTTTVSNATLGTGVDNVMVCNLSNPYNLMEVGPTYVMKPGEGYWMHVSVDAIWTVDY